MKSLRGFSLLEILVALAIVGLVLGSALFVLGSRAEQQARLEQQDRARWVAANVLARLRVEQVWPDAGQQEGEVAMGEQLFRWRMDVLDTEQSGIRRVEVRVYGGSDEAHQHILARLTTLVSQP